MTRLVDWEQQGVTHQGLAVFIRGARISDILCPNRGGKLFADDLTAMVPTTWTPVFVWLTSAAEAEDIEDEWSDEEEWQHNMSEANGTGVKTRRQRRQGGKQR